MKIKKKIISLLIFTMILLNGCYHVELKNEIYYINDFYVVGNNIIVTSYNYIENEKTDCWEFDSENIYCYDGESEIVAIKSQVVLEPKDGLVDAFLYLSLEDYENYTKNIRRL